MAKRTDEQRLKELQAKIDRRKKKEEITKRIKADREALKKL
jgi:hypothetical protein